MSEPTPKPKARRCPMLTKHGFRCPYKIGPGRKMCHFCRGLAR